MKEMAFRLVKGDDLKARIEQKCSEEGINTAVVLSGVGSVTKLKIRLAKALDYLELEKEHEIVSMTGTVSNGKCHIHVSLSDENGNCIGGHLEKGCIIDTTCELVFGVLEEYTSQRTYDESTGFNEIVFKKK